MCSKIMSVVGSGKLFPKSHLLFYSFIPRYWAYYSFRGSPLFPNYSQLQWSLHHYWCSSNDCCCCPLKELSVWRSENTLSAAAEDGWIRAIFLNDLAHVGSSELYFHHSQGSNCGATPSAAAKYVGNSHFIPLIASESKHGKAYSKLRSLLVGFSSDA